jgi:hypothetical protein
VYLHIALIHCFIFSSKDGSCLASCQLCISDCGCCVCASDCVWCVVVLGCFSPCNRLKMDWCGSVVHRNVRFCLTAGVANFFLRRSVSHGHHKRSKSLRLSTPMLLIRYTKSVIDGLRYVRKSLIQSFLKSSVFIYASILVRRGLGALGLFGLFQILMMADGIHPFGLSWVAFLFCCARVLIKSG